MAAYSITHVFRQKPSGNWPSHRHPHPLNPRAPAGAPPGPLPPAITSLFLFTTALATVTAPRTSCYSGHPALRPSGQPSAVQNRSRRICHPRPRHQRRQPRHGRSCASLRSRHTVHPVHKIQRYEDDVRGAVTVASAVVKRKRLVIAGGSGPGGTLAGARGFKGWGCR